MNSWRSLLCFSCSPSHQIGPSSFGSFCFSTLLLARLADHTILIETYELRGPNSAVHEATVLCSFVANFYVSALPFSTFLVSGASLDFPSTFCVFCRLYKPLLRLYHESLLGLKSFHGVWCRGAVPCILRYT